MAPGPSPALKDSRDTNDPKGTRAALHSRGGNARVILPRRMSRWPLHLASLLLALPLVQAEEPPPNTLTEAERQAGWRLLFDGTSTDGWRGFKASSFPSRGWVVEDGVLRHTARGRGGDIITVEKFSNYEFHFDWKINPGGNGGVKYFITEERDGAIGHEYQLLGPRSHEEAIRDLKHGTASFYDVLPPNTNALPRPPGEWNRSAIIVRGDQIEHWLNGERVLTYELGSPAVREAIARSKFNGVVGFGTAFPHHILLQDHGGDISFRNLKLRPLIPKR